jgi:L-fuconolactonase
VLVQAAHTVAETEWLLEQTKASEVLIRGVVGWVDMSALSASEDIARLVAGSRLVGVRPMLGDIPDDEWILRPELTPALKVLQRMQVAFDL